MRGRVCCRQAARLGDYVRSVVRMWIQHNSEFIAPEQISNAIVEGEQRYWVHVAIDFFSGRGCDK